MRDYYYELTERGELLLDGSEQVDPWFLDFFFRRLAPTANPDYPDHPFVCRCGDEMNYLRPHDTPIVFTGLDGDRLRYGSSLTVPLYADRLAYNSAGVLYHAAPVGGYGRLVPTVAMAVASQISSWGPLYAVVNDVYPFGIPLTPLHLLDRLDILHPKRENACVGCGGANPWSFKMSFVHTKDDGNVRTWVRPDLRMQGAMGTTHGGFVSLLLDETMGKVLSVRGVRAPTAQLNVRFSSPMRVGTEYEVRAWIDRHEGRKYFVYGEIRSSSDTDAIIASAEALFLAITPQA